MEHRKTYEQTHKKQKSTTAAFVSLAVAGALLLGGTKVGSMIFKNKDKDVPTTTKPETTMVTPESTELVLTEDFDINNPEAVSKRAQDIYNLSEKKISVFDIQNSIYVLNEMYDKIKYPEVSKTDDQKFEYLQQLALVLGATLDDYLADYVVTMDQILDEKISEPIFAGTTNSVPCAYMWMPASCEAKKTAIEIAKVYYEQRANIRDNNLAAMTITANDYYDLYSKAKDIKFKTGDKILVFKQFSSINPIFTTLLSKEQARDLDDALGVITTSTNKLFSSASENLDLSQKLKDGLENGNFGKSITKLEEKYVISDRQDAESRIETIASEITTIVDNGGTPASGSDGKQEVIDNGTTNVSTSEFVVDVPNEGTSEITVPGGDVVEEHTTESVTAPSMTETTTYIDADDDIPVMDDKELFAEATDEDIEDYKKSPFESIGYGMMGVGSLGAVFSKKRKK